jgi:outer membrane receptor for ferrienterochelin and colicins
MKLLMLCFILMHAGVCAQQITGNIYDQNGAPLPGASVYWSGTTTGTVSGNDGSFSLQKHEQINLLVVSYIGLRNDTVPAVPGKQLQIRMQADKELEGVEINAKKEATDISTIKPRNIERITERELLKAACCNLSESFETNPTVDVNYADAVTGAKEIQMLGLSGVYTQFLAEAIPALTGLGSIYGLNYIPGPWMESIQISKGAGSVVNGYESITGQINIEFKKPETFKERMYVNVFGDSEGRVELNTINKIRINDGLSDIFMVHGSMSQSRIDHNDDGFMDMPLAKQINIYNRLGYNSGKTMEGQAGFRIIAEDRMGGEMDFEKSDRGTTNLYGAVVNSRRLEAFVKTGMVNPAKPYQSMGIQLNGIYHDHKSWFGLKQYDAVQHSFYANYGYITKIVKENHRVRIGADFKADKITETLNDRDYNSTENVPGVYTEYTWDNIDKWGVIAGMRADYHEQFGWFICPRANVKYNFSPNLIVRVSGGKGFRTPLTFADNIGVFSSSRHIVVLEAPAAEEAWNSGANVTARFKWHEREGSISADYYYTSFINQYIIDPYSVPEAVLYYNLSGQSTASSMQLTLSYELVKGLEVRVSGKLDDVSTDYIYKSNASRPLYSKEKGLITASYETEKKRWRFDGTWQWNGKKNLPARAGAHQHEGNEIKESPSFSIVNCQATRVYRKWELYAGTDYMQVQRICWI